MQHYTIQTNQGIKNGPMTLAQLEDMARHGRVKPMTMVLVSNSNHWQTAANIPEVRAILKKIHPSQSSQLKDKKPGIAEKLAKRVSAVDKSRRSGDKTSDSHGSDRENKETDNELYTVRAGDGIEYGPADFEEVKRLVKLGRVKATTMILRKTTKRWHLAASIPEIRALVRKYNPSQNTTLDRIRAFDQSGTDPRRSSTVRLKIRQPFWKKFFSH